MDFLKYLINSSEVENLLIIGSYRDNEVKEGHPLWEMLNDIKSNSETSNMISNIVLKPLDEDAVNRMVSETLKRDYADTALLSSYIYRKTKGNPFFINQLLNSLYQKGILKFNEDKLTWDWNLNEIEKVQISNNVADFLIETLNELPHDTLEVIKRASCLGTCFDLKALYLISSEHENISDPLWLAILRDFVVPVNNKYKLLHMPRQEFMKSDINIRFCFSHDRIQQSVYSLISDSDKVNIHQKIGKNLLKIYSSQNNLDSNIFEVINHLNIAKDLIQNKDERIELAKLNYKAGIKANSNSAYNIAANYFMTGKSLLSSEEQNQYPDLYFNLSFLLAETHFLASNLDAAFSMSTDLFAIAGNVIEKAKVHELKAKIIDIRGEKREAVIDEIRHALKLFDVNLPSDIPEIDAKLGESISKMAAYLQKSQIEDLINLPKMTDENKKMIMKLLFQVQPATFQSYPPLNFLIQLTMFEMALTYGTTEVSCKTILNVE